MSSGRTEIVAAPAGKREAGKRAARHGRAAGCRRVAGMRLVRADEGGDESVGRPAVDLDRRAGLADLALAHDDDEVGHGHRLALVVGDDDGGDAEPLLQLAELDLHRLAQLGVERRQRLVEEEQPRRQRQRPGDRDALALAAGELCDRTVGEAGQMDEVEELGDPLPLLAVGSAADAQRIGDIAADVEMRERAPATGRPCRSRGGAPARR